MDYVRALEAAKIETPWIKDRLAEGRTYAAHPSYAIRIDGEIAAVAGLVIYPGKGRASGWAIWTPLGYRRRRVVHELTGRYLEALKRRYRLVRVEAEVVSEFVKGRRWLEHLGFVEEGPPRLLAGVQGETMQNYVWLDPDALLVAPEPVHALLEPARRPDGSVVPAIAGAYDGGATMYIMIALTVAAAAASAYTAYQAGEAQKAGHEYQAKVAENQAQIAAQQAEYAAQQQRAHDRKVMAAARAAQGVSGVETGEGSSLLVDIENARQSALNAEAARYVTEARTSGLTGQAGIERWQGRLASQQGTMQAGATLLGGVAGAGAKAYNPTPQTVRVQPGGSSGDIDLGYAY